ncbi:MG2 domain-containing protein [Massilia pinisoli]|uniref:MG2 domain-containing protein n=1 Tax=Massilia pinisoli TaxID=1772194 RepID=A0ABT1ZXX7_9BURK|nr:alpha-2-macroglobulin family protein [Massilia pinisoli]MCS0584686.1 MG2 domain-containing protein [Massilia pinisoli]
MPSFRPHLAHAVLAIATLACVPALAATTVVDVGPAKTQRDVRQVRIRFSDDVAALGNDRAGDAATVACSDPDLKAVGHWIDARNWVGEFARALPDGVACIVRPLPVSDLKGQPVAMPAPWRFDTGGPLAAIRFFQSPLKANLALEEPVAMFAPSAPVDPASLAHLACNVNGAAQPVSVLAGAQAQDVIDRYRKANPRAESRQDWVVARCGSQAWPNDADVTWVWGKDIRSRYDVAHSLDQTFRLRVRPPLTVSVECTVMAGTPGCDPRGPVTFEFSEKMTLPADDAIALVGGAGRRYPVKHASGYAYDANRFQTDALMAEGEQLAPVLDKPLTDMTGRTIRTVTPQKTPLVVSHLPAYAAMAQQQGVIPWKPGRQARWALALRNTEPKVGVRAWHLDGARDRNAALLALHRSAALDGLRTTSNAPHQPAFARSAALLDEVGARAASMHVDQQVVPSGRALELAPVTLSGYGTWLVEVDSPRYRARLAADAKALAARYPGPNGARQLDSARLALVQLTNLRIHARLSDRYPSLVWVTAIDSAAPQADTLVDVHDCRGTRLFSGRTDAQGRLRIAQPLAPPTCGDASDGLWFVARHGADVAVLQHRPGLPHTEAPRQIVHAILDRTLLSPGETLSMQAVARLPDANGYTVPHAQTGKLRIVDASGAKVHEAPLAFDARGSALHQWRVPPGARLGTYDYMIFGDDGRQVGWGTFQVEAFRLPVFEARLNAHVTGEGKAPAVDLAGSLAFLAGGSAANQPVVVRGRYTAGAADPVPGYGFADMSRPPIDPPSFAERRATLDLAGRYHAKVDVPVLDTPLTLHAEMEFADPNGETNVQPADVAVWPRARKVGLAVRRGTVADSASISVIVVDAANHPVPGQVVTVDAARAHYVRGIDWRGYWSEEPGARIPACTARTDEHGKAQCTVPWTGRTANEWLFRAAAPDASSGTALVHPGLFRWGSQESAIALADEHEPEAGQPVKLRLRPPFLPATALLTVEREGVLASHVLAVTSADEEIMLPSEPEFAPGVRLVAQFVRAADGVRDDIDPDAELEHDGTLDLHFARASHELDVEVTLDRATARPGDTVQADVRVRHAGAGAAGARVTLVAVDDALNLLKPNDTWALMDSFWRDRYIVMGNAHSILTLQRSFPFGPIARAWPELESLLQRYAARTSNESRGMAEAAAPAPAPPASEKPVVVTGQRAVGVTMDRNRGPLQDLVVAEDVGALPGMGAPRADFSSLAMWKADVQLDQDGHARVAIPLPDSLTRWRIVALAMDGADSYGIGKATVRTRKELQMLSGLPPVVRGGDELDQKITLRNDSDRALTVRVRAEASAGASSPLERAVTLPARASQSVSWRVRVPTGVDRIDWRIAARADRGEESDALLVTQRVTGMPVTVRDSMLVRVDHARSVPVALPHDALPGLGGVTVQWTGSPGAAAVAGAQAWMAAYPYRCMEQMVSMAVVSGDVEAWNAAMDKLPQHLAANGLVEYFPDTPGSDVLTAYLLDMSAATGWPLPGNARDRMETGLRNVLAHPDLAQWPYDLGLLDRRLALQAALGATVRAADAVVPKNLDALPTIALLDWVRYVLTTPDDALRRERLDSAAASLRNRYDLQGTRLRWRGDGSQQRWWMMWTGDVVAARTALLVQQWAQSDARWRDDVPRMILSLVDVQANGHWNTTVANAWAVVALRRLALASDGAPVTGTSTATLGTQSVARAWPDPAPALLSLPGDGTGAALALDHKGTGAPWATVQVKAATRTEHTIAHGLAVSKTIAPVQQRVPGRWSEGDVMRVTLHIVSHGDNGWLAIDDPIPSGATILGKGLGGESLTAQLKDVAARVPWMARPTYVERGSDSYRAYYARVTAGEWDLSYTVRLNNAGSFRFPATRVEAMYAPEIFGEAPNVNLDVAQ